MFSPVNRKVFIDTLKKKKLLTNEKKIHLQNADVEVGVDVDVVLAQILGELCVVVLGDGDVGEHAVQL